MPLRKKGWRWLDSLASEAAKHFSRNEEALHDALEAAAEAPFPHAPMVLPYILCSVKKGAASSIYGSLLGEQYIEYSGVLARLGAACKAVRKKKPGEALAILHEYLGDDMDTVLASAELLIRVLRKMGLTTTGPGAIVAAKARSFSLLEQRAIPYVYVDEDILREYLYIGKSIAEKGLVINHDVIRLIKNVSRLLINGFTVILTGDEGVGKHAVAYMVAKNLISSSIRAAIGKTLSRGRRGVFQVIPGIDRRRTSHYRLWRFFYSSPTETLMVIDTDTRHWLTINGFLDEDNSSSYTWREATRETRLTPRKNIVVITLDPGIYSEEDLVEIMKRWCSHAAGIPVGGLRPVDIVTYCVLGERAGADKPGRYEELLTRAYRALGDERGHIHVAVVSRNNTVHRLLVKRDPWPLIDIANDIYGLPSHAWTKPLAKVIEESALAEVEPTIRSLIYTGITEKNTAAAPWLARSFPRTTLRQISLLLEEGQVDEEIAAEYIENVLLYSGLLSPRDIDVIKRINAELPLISIIKLSLDEIELRSKSEATWSDKRKLARILNSIGIRYMAMGYPHEAEEPLIEAVSLMEELVYTRGMEILENELARIYNNLGILYMELGRLDEAIELLRKAVEIRRRLVYVKNIEEHVYDLARSLNNYATALYEKRRLREAIELYKEALDLLEKMMEESESPVYLAEYAKTLTNLAHAYSAAGNHEEALRLLREAYTLLREAGRLSPEKEVALLSEIARLYSATGMYDKAIETYNALLEKIRGECSERIRSVDVYNTLYELALTYYRRGDSSEAERILRGIIEAVERDIGRLGASDELYEVLGNAYNSLAHIRHEKGDVEGALELYEKARRVREMLVYGRGRANAAIGLARTLSSMATIYSDLGRTGEAEKLYREALSLLEYILTIGGGVEAEIEYAHVLNNLALLLADTGRFREALELLEKARDIRRRLVYEKKMHEVLPDLATTLNNEALVYMDIGKPDKALELFREAAEIREALANETGDPRIRGELASTLNNMAMALMQLDEKDEALGVLRKALRILEELVRENPDSRYYNQLANTLNNMASILAEKGEYEEALKLYDRAEEIRRRLVHEEGMEYARFLANTLSNKASLLARLGEKDAALKLYMEAKELLEKAVARKPHAEDWAQLARIESNIAKLLYSRGEPGDAVRHYRRAIEIWRRLVEEQGLEEYLPELIEDLRGYAAILTDIEEYEEAIMAAEEAVRLAQRLVVEEGLWEYSRLYAEALRVLAVAYHRAGRKYDALVTYSDAEDIYKPLVYDEGVEEAVPGLADVLLGKAIIYLGEGRYEYAAIFGEEAIDLLKKLVYRLDRKEYIEKLSVAIKVTVNAYRELGNKKKLAYLKREACRLLDHMAKKGLAADKELAEICRGAYKA